MFEQSQVTTYSATLLGAKQFKGEIDGNKIDSCTVLVASPMPANGNSVGFTAASMKFGDSHNFEKLKNLNKSRLLRFPTISVRGSTERSCDKLFSPKS